MTVANTDFNPRRMKVLITGGAGCIGSHLTQHLVYNYPNYEIYVFDKLDYCSSLSGLKPLFDYSNFHFIKGDICSSEFVQYIISTNSINVIIHLAAQTHVDNSFGDSFEFTKTNIYGTHVLLEAAKTCKITKFIHVSTDEVYGEVTNGPNKLEDSILAPSNPYSATKAAAEMIVLAYFKSFNLPIIISRSNNIYGPSQYPEKVIPKFISSLLLGKKCEVHGNGSNSRRYLYVSDVVDALIKVLHNGLIGEIYNIGSDFEITNLQLAKYLIQKLKLGDPESHIEFVEDRAFNDKRYAIDSEKVKELGWHPKIDFDEGIELTVNWYKENLHTYWKEDVNVPLSNFK